MNLQSSDFELFGLSAQFAQDRAVLDARWKELQRQAHPDKFAAQGAAAQRLALQWSVRINQAYQRLKDPLARAAYLCELNGEPVNAENNTAMPADFLQQQMAWRESLDEAQGGADLEELAAQVVSKRAQAVQQCHHLLDVRRDWAAAVQQVRALMFIERFGRDVQARLDQLDAAEQGQ